MDRKENSRASNISTEPVPELKNRKKQDLELGIPRLDGTMVGPSLPWFLIETACTTPHPCCSMKKLCRILQGLRYEKLRSLGRWTFFGTTVTGQRQYKLQLKSGAEKLLKQYLFNMDSHRMRNDCDTFYEPLGYTNLVSRLLPERRNSWNRKWPKFANRRGCYCEKSRD